MDAASWYLVVDDEEAWHNMLSSNGASTHGCSSPILRAFLSERRSSGRKLCPDPRVGADDGGVYGRRFSLLEASSWSFAFSSDEYGLGFPGENPSFG